MPPDPTPTLFAPAPASTKGRVSTSYVRLLYDFLNQRGEDAATLLGRPAPEPDPSGTSFIAVSELAQLYWKADQALQVPALGVQIATLIQPRYLGLLGYLLSHCPTLGHALHRHHEFERLYWDANTGEIRPLLNGVRLQWPAIAATCDTRALEECNVAAFVAFARTMTGMHHENPIDVQFTFAQPASMAPYDAFFRCPIRFNAPKLSVSVSYANLLRPLQHVDAALFEILALQAQERLRRFPVRDDNLSALRAAIATQMAHAPPTLANCADRLGCSARTLQRRLEETGHHFQAVLDEAKKDLALSYLDDPALKLSELALLLGYADQAAFTRAFKRWTGESPAKWRRQRQTKV